MIHNKTAEYPHLLLRVGVGVHIGSSRLLPSDITTRGSSSRRRHRRCGHLLDLLGAGSTAAEQEPCRPGRADEIAIGNASPVVVVVLLLPFLAVLPVGPGLGGDLEERAGAGLVRPEDRLPLQAGAYGGGRRRRAREAPHVLEEQGSHGVVACSSVTRPAEFSGEWS